MLQLVADGLVLREMLGDGSILKILVIFIAGYLLAFSSNAVKAQEEKNPLLRDTILYKNLTHDCKSVDVSYDKNKWKNILKNRKIKLAKLELCGENEYKIFTASLWFDPNGDVSSQHYFNRLLIELGSANSKKPFAFVDTRDNWITEITIDKNVYSFEYERYLCDSPSAQWGDCGE